MALRDTGRGAGGDGCEFFPRVTQEEKPIWIGIYESLRDALFPPKLPPLELTSMPIPVVDRMAAKTSPWAVGTSAVVNGCVLAIAIWLGLTFTTHPRPTPIASEPIDLSQWMLSVSARANHSGGGGGSNEATDPIEGRPPKVELTPISPPQVSIVDKPKLAADAAIAAPPDIRLPDNPDIPNIGVPKSSNVTLASNGPGAHGSIGWHGSGGDGPGGGPGWGPGPDSGVYVAGRGGVTAPVAIVTPEAEFSDEARRQKYQGICLVALIVDAHGFPQNVHAVQHLGMGLDEKAMEAIRNYRFRPAMKDGKPVASTITVEVDFRLF